MDKLVGLLISAVLIAVGEVLKDENTRK